VLLGCVIGGGMVATIMYHQINNRYTMGFNTGFIHGGNKIIEFLDTHIENELTGKKVKVLNKYLDHKVSRISVLNINGVKTITIK
jgi:hypothetical protein